MPSTATSAEWLGARVRQKSEPSYLTKPEEYRFNAEECERMSENALNPKDKAAWHRLAKHWLRMITTPGTGSERSKAGQSDPGR
jgi:hypothetical protein